MSTAAPFPPNLSQHRLWMHDDVQKGQKRWPHLSKRLGQVLQHMKVSGEPNILKTCQGPNRGWYRSPLGSGSTGMGFYVWWTQDGSSQWEVKDPGPGRHILIRAIRSHDDHTRLLCGDWEKHCYEIQADDLEDREGNFVSPPWTPDQVRYADDTRPVRLILGPPGSGKTSVLWRSVETQEDQRVLYLTWSSYLTNLAQDRFAAFAPPSVTVQCLDFATCLGMLGGQDISRPTLNERIQRFEEMVQGLRIRDKLGPWQGHVPALYAELRGVLFGWALPGADNTCTRGGLLRLSDKAYRQHRSDDLGPSAVKALIRLIAHLEDHGSGQDWEKVFPDLAGADRALAQLQATGVPAELADFTQLVVDELQDLTLREILVVTELCRVRGATSNEYPSLVLAADEGQTVRPTTFDIGRVKRLLRDRLGAPQEFTLSTSLRSPQRLSEVIERASNLYARLDKKWRPKDQLRPMVDPHWEAERLHAVVPCWETGKQLLQTLQDDHQVSLVCLREQDRDQLPNTVSLLDPEVVKGQEFQVICLLNPGQLLLDILLHDEGRQLEDLHKRTQIDRLRVALSRATATLIFLDIASSQEAIGQSRDLLGEKAVYTAKELLSHLDAEGLPVHERAWNRAQEAQALGDTDLHSAWFRALQAWSLLGTPGVPNSVSDDTIREKVAQTVLTIGAQVLVAETTGELDREEVDNQGRILLKDGRNKALVQAWTQLERWGQNPTDPPFDLLDAWVKVELVAPWLKQAMTQRQQVLAQQIKGGARVPDQAPRYAGPVKEWLRCLGLETADAKSLRQRAVDTLLQAKRLDEAENVLDQLSQSEHARWGRLWEYRNDWEKAIRFYKRAKLWKDVQRLQDLQKAPVALTDSILERNRQVLLRVQDTLRGANATALGTWQEDTAIQDFEGITISGDPPHVVLNLSSKGLQGSIPPELHQLSHLMHLSLDENQLTGPIPPELGQLAQLTHLLLFGNQLTGSIPPELGQLTQLTDLDLSGNQLTRPVPPELGQLTQLKFLDLSGNQLTGPVPPELGQLTQLTQLLLSGNQLTGPVPPELGQLTQLIQLLLSGNQLTGPVPPELDQLIDLSELVNKPDEAKAVTEEIRDNLTTPEAPLNNLGPDASPTQQVTATSDTTMPRERPDGLPEPYPELKPALQNQEHFNVAALHEALNIFRDTMSPFIISHLGHVFTGNTEEAIRRALPKETSVRFEQRLRKNGNIEACIDIDDCCSLVRYYWDNIFSALFQDDSEILSTLSLLDDGPNQVAHPRTSDLDSAYVYIRLSHISNLLKRIGKPGPADEVLEIRDGLAPLDTPSPVVQPSPANEEIPIPVVSHGGGFGDLSTAGKFRAILSIILLIGLGLILLFNLIR